MGMYDNIKCEIPLPIPEDAEELKDVVWANIDFQTKSLMNCLSYYVIGFNKELHEQRHLQGDPLSFWDADDEDIPTALVPCHYHGIVEFYTYLQKDKNDYHITFKATFTQGKVVDLVLLDFEQEDNKGRLVKEAVYRKELEHIRDIRTRWWYTVYRIFYRKPIMWAGRKTRACTQWIYSKSWQLERWLTRL